MTDLSRLAATDAEVREIAREAGEGAAQRTFDLLFGRLGINTADAEEMRELKKDFAHVRRQRTESEDVRSHLRRGLLDRVLGGVAYVLAAVAALLAGTWMNRGTHGP